MNENALKQMKKSSIRIFASVLALMSCGGCSTLMQHDFLDPTIFGHADPGVYRGTQDDFNFIFRTKHIVGPQPPDPDLPVTPGQEIFWISYGIIDFPFSLTADTLVFPYDVTTIHKEQKPNEHVVADELYKAAIKFREEENHWPKDYEELSGFLKHSQDKAYRRLQTVKFSHIDFIILPNGRLGIDMGYTTTSGDTAAMYFEIAAPKTSP